MKDSKEKQISQNIKPEQIKIDQLNEIESVEKYELPYKRSK